MKDRHIGTETWGVAGEGQGRGAEDGRGGGVEGGLGVGEGRGEDKT